MWGKDAQSYSITTGSMIRFFAIILGMVVIYYVHQILIALVFAIIVASALEPAIEWLRARGIPRILGVIILYLVTALFVFFLFYLIFPLFAEELRNILNTYPTLQQQVLSGIGRLPLGSLFGNNIEDFLRVSTDYIDQVGGSIFGFATVVFGGIFSFLLIIVFSFYIAVQERGIETFLRLVTPLAHEPYVIDLWERSRKKLGRWLRAQMLLGVLVGVLIFFGLTFLGVRHALLFAALAGIFEIIPIVGPILSAVPAVAVALLSSPLLGLLTTVLYIVVQQVESHVIVPVVMRKAVGLSPLIVVLALLIGAKLGGIFGILLAVPLTVILAEFINDWDKKKRALIPE